MDVFEFINGLEASGTPFADTESEDFCPEHGWDLELYHHEWCRVFAAKLGLS